MLRLLIYGCPGTGIFELGEAISEFHRLPFMTIEQVPDEVDNYFSDTIPSTSLDTGDMSSGSDQQQMVRDPSSVERDKAMDAVRTVGNIADCAMDAVDLASVFRLRQGVVVTEIPEEQLCRWATHIVYLHADETDAIEWFSGRWKCIACGNVHHDNDKPPREVGICDRCGTDLIQLEEDNSSAVKEQYKNWRNSFWRFKEQGVDNAHYKIYDTEKFPTFKGLVSHIDLWTREAIEKIDWYAIARDNMEPLGENPHDGPFRWNPAAEQLEPEPTRRSFH